MSMEPVSRGNTLAFAAITGLLAGLTACSPSVATTPEVVVAPPPEPKDAAGGSETSAAAATPSGEEMADLTERKDLVTGSGAETDPGATHVAETAGPKKQETVATTTRPKPKPKPANPGTPASPKSCCAGKNACKGLGGCKTADNACMGKNNCKGKGGCAMGRCP